MEKINVLKSVAVLLVWLLILKPCVGSYFTMWEGPGCVLPAEGYAGCDCFLISQHGGYKFVYEGQPVFLHNSYDCQGAIHTTLAVNTTDCTGFEWNSFIIGC
ncbi:hypothetical protein SUGI_0540820 [Cryptomeria japonica]|nr:hypothetical protein SUGI_0540820 [Cryptomeria japonica]